MSDKVLEVAVFLGMRSWRSCVAWCDTRWLGVSWALIRGVKEVGGFLKEVEAELHHVGDLCCNLGNLRCPAPRAISVDRRTPSRPHSVW